MKDDVIKFWENYVAPIIPDILLGKKWYSFSFASIRTMEELGLAKKQQEGGWHIVQSDYTFVINSIGDLECVFYPKYSNPAGTTIACMEHSPKAKMERFIISLPRISFHQ